MSAAAEAAPKKPPVWLFGHYYPTGISVPFEPHRPGSCTPECAAMRFATERSEGDDDMGLVATKVEELKRQGKKPGPSLRKKLAEERAQEQELMALAPQIAREEGLELGEVEAVLERATKDGSLSSAPLRSKPVQPKAARGRENLAKASHDKSLSARRAGKPKAAEKPEPEPKSEPKRDVSGRGQGSAKKGDTVRIVRRKPEEKEGVPQVWRLWEESTNRRVVNLAFPTAAAAQLYATGQGWKPKLTGRASA